MNVATRLFCAAALGLLAAGCSKLTVENYDKLEAGMKYEAVKKLLGPPARCSDVLTVKSCTWGDDQRYVQVSFVADQVVLFTSHNLR